MSSVAAAPLGTNVMLHIRALFLTRRGKKQQCTAGPDLQWLDLMILTLYHSVKATVLIFTSEKLCELSGTLL
jgi:hypothetical protein